MRQFKPNRYPAFRWLLERVTGCSKPTRGVIDSRTGTVTFVKAHGYLSNPERPLRIKAER